MEHVEMLSTVFKVHNKRESLMLNLIRNKVHHTLQLEDINYMRQSTPEWTIANNNQAIHNNLQHINGYLLCCYYLDMIDEPFTTICTLDDLKELY